ncbi:MAG: hypothetical protein KF801_09720 [Cryobacterium sp.]|nr:hypothetical protein [Cryobacterium sp.]
MRSVAFFRNLNQGQRGSPSSDDLRLAFEEASATQTVLVRSNGTVMFTATDPDACVSAVLATLHSGSEWQDVAFARPRAEIRELALEFDPGLEGIGRMELSLFDHSVVLAGELPIAGRRCEIVRAGAGFAICRNDRDGESNAVPTLEALLGAKVTSRSLPTVHQLFKREPLPSEGVPHRPDSIR